MARRSSQAALSLETSHSFPETALPCAPSDSSLPLSSTTLASTPSLYVTFKVLQLVNTFRKRVKTRVLASRFPKKEASRRVTNDFCQDFERQAFDEIDRYLGRKTAHPISKRRTRANRPIASSKRTGSDPATTVVEEEVTPTKTIDWLLERIDQVATSDTHCLSTVATRDKLFVERRADFTISHERLSLKELTELLVVIKDLLATLTRAAPSRPGAKTVCEGNEVLDLSLDETYVANLEHLLHCLKDQVLRLLVSKLVELVQKHVVECQRDQSKHCEQWFFEFPDARHPLSTTWPWSIRPSLAVLWGVCWMFYDFFNNRLPPDTQNLTFDEDVNLVNEQGVIVYPNHAIVPYLASMQREQQGQYPANPDPRQAFGLQQGPGTDPRLPRTLIPQSPSSDFDTMTQPQPHPRSQNLPRGLTVATSPQPQPHSRAPDQVPHTAPGLAIQGTNNTYTAAPSAYSPSVAPAHTAGWLPQDTSATGLTYPDNAFAADVDSWGQQFPQHSLPEQQASQFDLIGTLPPQGQSRVTPTIRLTTDLDNFSGYQQQPQDIYSATSHSSNSSAHLQDSPYVFNQYAGHLSPQNTRFMHLEQREMQTPPRSPQEAAIGDQNPRKRSHSIMSGGAGAQPQSAVDSISASPGAHSPGDEYSSPRNRTAFKRGDPPVNHENKFVCDFSAECTGLTFDRKCEWSKHMDKHDRPYRCPHPSCAKLQGFTYSGGLLRHEREVHGKHGGPKSQLMCPHEDCKRHTGKGFTRKENLNEHIRRVHQSRELQSQTNPLRRDGTDVMPGAEEAQTPASRASEMMDPEDPNSPVLKRRRYMPEMSERSASEDVEDMKQELKRLRAENAEKDSKLMQMELRMADTAARQQEEMRALREDIRSIQPGQGHS